MPLAAEKYYGDMKGKHFILGVFVLFSLIPASALAGSEILQINPLDENAY